MARTAGISTPLVELHASQGGGWRVRIRGMIVVAVVAVLDSIGGTIGMF